MDNRTIAPRPRIPVMPTTTAVEATPRPRPKGPFQSGGRVKVICEEGTITPADEQAAAYAVQNGQ